MKRINFFSISATLIVSYALAMMVALGNPTDTTTSGLPGGSTSPLLAAITAAREGGDRDKSGTSAVQIEQVPLQTPQFNGVTNDRAFRTERGRFELPLPLRADRFSKPAHSTTLPPLQNQIAIQKAVA